MSEWLVITADFVRERRKTVLGLHSFVCLVLAVIYSYVDQKLTSCTSVGVSGSRMWSVVGCFAGGLGRARGSCGWVSRARTLSTWRATSSAAAGAVFVRSQSSVMHMRTRSPRAAAAIQATAIMDGGTRRNSVSVDKERLHKYGQLYNEIVIIIQGCATRMFMSLGTRRFRKDFRMRTVKLIFIIIIRVKIATRLGSFIHTHFSLY